MIRLSPSALRTLAAVLLLVAALSCGLASGDTANAQTTRVQVRAYHVLCSKGDREQIPKPLLKDYAKNLRKTGYNVFRIARTDNLALETGKVAPLKLPGGLGSGSVTLLADGRVALALRNHKKAKVLVTKTPLPLTTLVGKLRTKRGEVYLLVMESPKKK